jgi:hypothetical protein
MENFYGLSGLAQSSGVRPEICGDFTATKVDDESITLTWTEGTTAPEEIQIERSLTDSNYLPLAEVYPGIETFTDEDLEADTEYFYRIRYRKHQKWSDFEKDSATTDES